jgi:hypothetical protein
MLQANFIKGEQILLPCILLGVSGLYLKELEKTPLLNNTHNAKPSCLFFNCLQDECPSGRVLRSTRLRQPLKVVYRLLRRSILGML